MVLLGSMLSLSLSLCMDREKKICRGDSSPSKPPTKYIIKFSIFHKNSSPYLFHDTTWTYHTYVIDHTSRRWSRCFRHTSIFLVSLGHWVLYNFYPWDTWHIYYNFSSEEGMMGNLMSKNSTHFSLSVTLIAENYVLVYLGTNFPLKGHNYTKF